MTRFERELYRDPDQDLNKLWWDLAEKYQELHRPEGRNEPDYASKYHIVGAPIYYHNYMMGEMFASQLHHALVRAVVPGYSEKQAVEIYRRGPLGRRVVRAAAPAAPAPGPISAAIYTGNKAAGKFMKERVFGPGNTMPWNELTRHATGEDLSPTALAEDIGIAK
jgi:peptidyl-dipeptidase A